MEKDCTLKVERPVYEQEDLHKTYGYAKPRYTGECHFIIIRRHFGGEPQGKNHFEDLGVDGRVIRKLFLNKQNNSAWTGYMWFRIGTVTGSFEHCIFFFILRQLKESFPFSFLHSNTILMISTIYPNY